MLINAFNIVARRTHVLIEQAIRFTANESRILSNPVTYNGLIGHLDVQALNNEVNILQITKGQRCLTNGSLQYLNIEITLETGEMLSYRIRIPIPLLREFINDLRHYLSQIEWTWTQSDKPPTVGQGAEWETLKLLGDQAIDNEGLHYRHESHHSETINVDSMSAEMALLIQHADVP